jgi:hypothetical protein
MNMSVLSFESLAELFCLLKMIPTSKYNFHPRDIVMNQFTLPAKRGKKFWTSGANDGENCEGVYAWCALSELVPTGLLTAFTKAATSSSDHCLSLDTAGTDNSSVLAHSNCTNKMPYICEPKCKGPTCPSTCVKNVLIPPTFWLYT